MNNPNHLDNYSQVKNMINREKQRALDYFRKTDFESRMNLRLEADLKREHSFPFFLKKPFLVISSSVLACCATDLILYQILSISPYEKSVRIIEDFLLENTNLQQVLAEEAIPEKEREAIELSMEEELECWQSPKCRKKFFSQIIKVFKEV